MPANKYLKRDKPSEQYRTPSKIELLSKLAEEYPYGTDIYGYPKKGEEEPSVRESLLDPIPTPPAGKAFRLAISFPYATRQILQFLPKKGVLSAAKQKGIGEAIRILKATPKKALESISDLEIGNPEAYEKAGNILGHFSHEGIVGARPWTTFGGGQDYNLPEALSHEIGHGITERLLNRRGRNLADLYDPMFSSYENLSKQGWEGVAEYLGEAISKKAKVPYATKFTYGPVQQSTFEELTGGPSKNPYMNVYRYLQEKGVLE